MISMNSIEKIAYLILIPLLGSLYIKVSHLYSDTFLADRLLPYLISTILIIYFGRKHYIYWDKIYFQKKYLSIPVFFAVVAFLILQAFFLFKIDVPEWYSGLTNRSAPIYIFPYILSGYVVPFLLFSHVAADSLSYSKRIYFISISLLITVICFIFWLVKKGTL